MNELANILHDPFYIGLIRIKRTGETFEGRQQPLISTALFKRVQAVFEGKTVRRTQQHDFLFRRMLRCGRCQRFLVGERQKGHVYYRCHGQHAASSVREDVVDVAFANLLRPLSFSDSERSYFTHALALVEKQIQQHGHEARRALELSRHQVAARMRRLTDAFLDATIEQELFEERKAALLVERREIEDRLLATDGELVTDTLRDTLELASNACLLYQNGSADQKRQLLDIVSSNRQVDGKTPIFTLALPLNLIADREEMPHGGATRRRTERCKL